MIVIEHSEPQFIAKDDLVLYTDKGEYYIDKGDPIGLKRTDKIIYLGEDGDVLEFSSKSCQIELLESCIPSNFDLKLDEDDDLSIQPILLEGDFSIDDKVSRIFLSEKVINNTLTVNKISKSN